MSTDTNTTTHPTYENDAVVDQITREGLEDLARFAEHYPAQAIAVLRSNLISYAVRQLRAAGMNDTADLLANDLCVLDQYVELCPGGTYDPALAATNATWNGGLALDLTDSVGKVLGLMATEGQLSAWE